MKETLAGATYSESVIPTSNLRHPLGVAVDGTGNLFITDSYNAEVVKETFSGGTYTQRYVFGGPTWPDGIAVDKAGNVYVCAPDDNYVVKLISGVGSNWVHIGSGLLGPHGVAVDAQGNVVIADSNNSRILKETPSGSTYTQTVVASGLNIPQAIAVDANGDLYFNDPNGGSIFKLFLDAGRFGNVNVGTKSSTISVRFTFDTAGTIAAPAVVTRGATDLDFADAGTGTCTTNGTNHSYNIGDTCTVDVTFTPRHPGAEYGAAILKDSSGNTIATGYVQGTGSGPLANFVPAPQSVVPTVGLSSPYHLIVDANRNLYIVDTNGGQILKETLSAGSYVQSVAFSGLNQPTDVAIDGGGTFYILEWNNNRVLKATPSGTGFVQSVAVTGLSQAAGMTVDGNGNLYIADSGNNRVLKETPSLAGYSESVIASGLSDPMAVAADDVGNVYIADTGNNRVLKETLSQGAYQQSTLAASLNQPIAVSVDPVGNVYIADWQNNRVLKETLSEGAYTQNTVGTGLLYPEGVVADAGGNIYIADEGHRRIIKLYFTNPPSLSFATTPYGFKSTDSPQVIGLQNAGNAPLNFPIPASGRNPNLSTSFTLESGADNGCPITDPSSSAPGSILPGASCQWSVDFEPAAVGAISGTFALIDDSLNASSPTYATQTAQLSGTGMQAMSTITWSNPGVIFFGTNLGAILNASAHSGSTIVPGTYTYTATAAGGTTSTVTSATILGAGDYTLNVAFTPTDTVAYTSAVGSVALAVSTVTPTVALQSSANPQLLNQSVTFTATVSSDIGTPTGSVTFFNGSTQLGQSTLANGVATYTMAMPEAGILIEAMYAGDSNFTSAGSNALSQGYSDFGLQPGVSTTATVSAGSQANYALVVAATGTGIAKLQAPVSFSVTGLPSGATASFSPTTVPAQSQTTNVTLTVNTRASAAAAPANDPFGRKPLPVTLGAVLLLFLGRIRRASRIVKGRLALVLLSLAGSAALISLGACGGSGGSSTTPPPRTNQRTYTLTVTATEGSLSHTLTLTLNTY